MTELKQTNLTPVSSSMDETELVVTDRGLLDREGMRALEIRDASRKVIHQKVGDQLSLLGTATDGATKVLHDFSRLVTALAEADTLKDVRDAAAPFVETAQGFLDKVDSGEVVLPYQLKGEPAVMAEIETRATGVATVLKESAT